LIARDHRVLTTSRNPKAQQVSGCTPLALDVQIPEQIERLRGIVSSDTRVLLSLPTVPGCNFMPAVMGAIAAAARIVYLSTTGVYGAERDVDEHTLPQPRTEREQARVDAEFEVASAKSALVLRPAAIYGPHRGIHASLQAGTYRLLEGGANFVSRIHVDDLAAHCVAALFSDLTGAWPVADEEPCTSREIAEYCAALLHIPLPVSVPANTLSETRRADRRVDGSAIRRALGLTLKYPSYRIGIPACLAAEAEAPEALAGEAPDRAR
jgi:nucleoside-diphosphate-sugar epimerase